MDGHSAQTFDDIEPVTQPTRLAVIISCFNYERFVGRAIESVLRQNCDACDVVVVDDGSTDGSWRIIENTGVRALRTENGGQRAACLAGLAQTTAPFVLFLDADDELKPGALAAILAALDPDVAKLQFPLTRIDADGNVIGDALPELKAYRKRRALAREVLRTGVYQTPPTSGNVFRRDLCAVLHEADYDRAVDGVILFAAPFFGDVVSLGEPLGFYRVHGGNDSGLGRAPDAQLFKRDMMRFVARMRHLDVVIRRAGELRALAPPRALFHFRELTLGHALSSGRRARLRDLPGLLGALTFASLPIRRKAALASFFVLASVLPSTRGKALLAYRYRAGRRCLGGWLGAIVAPVERQ